MAPPLFPAIGAFGFHPACLKWHQMGVPPCPVGSKRTISAAQNNAYAMIEIAFKTYHGILVRWVDLVRRFALVVLLLSVTVTIGIAAYLESNMAINTDLSDMMSPDLEYRKQSRALSRDFPQFTDNLLIVIDGETSDLADDAATALTTRIREKPELFGGVYDLKGEAFFRRNGLLLMELDELADLSDRLAEAQPFLGALWRDLTLRGLFRMLGLASDEVLKEDGTAIEIKKVFTAIAEVAEAQAEGQFRRLSWQRLMMGDVDGGKEEVARRFIQIQPILDFTSLQPATAAMGALRRIAADLQLDQDHGVRVRLTGSVALSEEEFETVEKGIGLATFLSLILVVGLLLGGLRSPRLVIATLATLVMGLIWTAGFAIAAIGQLSLISVAFAVLFIGLSVDFGIHFALRYKEEIDRAASHTAALRYAVEDVGGALTLSAVAAAMAFYSFLPTPYLGLAELGLIAGTGMFIAFFANLTVLPAILTLMPIGMSREKAARRRRFAGSTWVMGHAGVILWAATALGLAATALLPQTRFDFDPMNLKDPKTESVSTLFDLMSDSRTSPYSITVLAKNLDEARDLAAKLTRLEQVKETITLLDYIPADQDEKLDIIGTMGLFLSPALAARQQVPGPVMEEIKSSLDVLGGKLQRLAASRKREGAAAKRLLAALRTVSDLADLEIRLLSSLPRRLVMLKQSLEAEPISLESLPKNLKNRHVAADGRVRIDVYPKEKMQDRDALASFVGAVRKLAPQASGSPVVIFEAGKVVVPAVRDAAVLAVVMITVLLAVILKSFKDVVLVFVPLFLAVLLTIATSVLLGLSFNYANVIVLPLLFGLGVASGIHLVLRQRNEGGTLSIFGTSTPRAVVFSGLTTIGSFGAIALSSHPGTSSMGMLLAISITLTLGCTLVVLPALMVFWKGATERGAS